MNRFYVITNHDKDAELELTHLICNYLKGKNCICTYMENYAVKEAVPEGTECVIVLGGDGTLIQAARTFSSLNIPVLGVNAGTLGYLTEIDREQVIPALDMLIEDRFFTDKRMMLHGEVIREGKTIYSGTAVNDIVVNRMGPLQVIDFDIYVNGEFLIAYHADGLIAATPTGSTAYNLSAGGPIVKPGTDIIAVTPVCPHMLNKSSIIFGGEDLIEIKMGKSRNQNEERAVTFDGADYFNLLSGDIIAIRKSEYSVKLIHTGKQNFLQILRNKMS